MSDLVLVALIGAAVTLIPTSVAGAWKWWKAWGKAVEERAYERARNEGLLEAATLALDAQGDELGAVKKRESDCLVEFDQERAEWIAERARLQARVAMQDQTILNLTKGEAG